ncbi:lamin tail domain-containing protein [Nocardioides sp. AE5]|uniref:lamin tail domain-containing protein n=1 Tax=Nocardioides sp. AE5 TaxID=2962573 RepID=UPI002881EFC7|nr:lamin tail domain-containing protein [Nocardioides sp. AE5]MDT0200950.1 lamin tail domain-containing protein [Nocardioides sp. AE5]
MRPLLLVVPALAVLLAAACSSVDSGGPGTDEPSGRAALGAYDGLCGWAPSREVERIFDGPVVITGGRECRIAAEGDLERTGVFHFVLEQHTGLDDLRDEVRVSATRGGFTLCGDEAVESHGMRVLRMLTCPGSKQDGWDFRVMVEVADGRVLASRPQEHPDAGAAEAASQRFVELLEVYAVHLQGQPLVNEVSPGEWVELYNPGPEPVDVGGWQVVATDRRVASTAGGESASPAAGAHAVTVPSGSTVPPGGHLVIDLGALEPVPGKAPMVALVDPGGLWVDEAAVGFVDAGEVIRRNGDGQPFCGFGTDGATPGTANPVSTTRC